MPVRTHSSTLIWSESLLGLVRDVDEVRHVYRLPVNVSGTEMPIRYPIEGGGGRDVSDLSRNLLLSQL